MIICQITMDSEDVQIVRELYEQSFPEEERLPFEVLLNLLSVADIDFCSYYIENQFIGFTYTFTVGKLCWFFYFAVVPEKRGEGLTYWHTYNNIEVDAVIGNARVAIEIKSTDNVQPSHKKRSC